MQASPYGYAHVLEKARLLCICLQMAVLTLLKHLGQVAADNMRLVYFLYHTFFSSTKLSIIIISFNINVAYPRRERSSQ